MEDVLNATIAGGVIIGTSADMIRNASICLLIGNFYFKNEGFIGGWISTYGYNVITPYLSKK